MSQKIYDLFEERLKRERRNRRFKLTSEDLVVFSDRKLFPFRKYLLRGMQLSSSECTKGLVLVELESVSDDTAVTVTGKQVYIIIVNNRDYMPIDISFEISPAGKEYPIEEDDLMFFGKKLKSGDLCLNKNNPDFRDKVWKMFWKLQGKKTKNMQWIGTEKIKSNKRKPVIISNVKTIPENGIQIFETIDGQIGYNIYR